MRKASKSNLTALSILLASALLIAGCASQSESGYDDERASQPRCPRGQAMKCTKRTASPEECACVPTGSIEHTIETLIGVPN